MHDLLTKMTAGMQGRSYDEIIKLWNLTQLETSWMQGDMMEIEVFEILKGFDKVEEGKLLTRGHGMKSFKYGNCLDCRKYCFSSTVVDLWNSLPSGIVDAA